MASSCGLSNRVESRPKSSMVRAAQNAALVLKGRKNLMSRPGTGTPQRRQDAQNRFEQNRKETRVFHHLSQISTATGQTMPQAIENLGGGYRNRTGLHGFAIRCVTSPPTRRSSEDGHRLAAWLGRCKRSGAARGQGFRTRSKNASQLVRQSFSISAAPKPWRRMASTSTGRSAADRIPSGNGAPSKSLPSPT